MKILLAALLIISAYGLENMTITCWDVCSENCKARYGWLTEQCVKSCGCKCDAQCDKLCLDFGLGWPCRFKCGCYQNYTFESVGKPFIKLIIRRE